MPSIYLSPSTQEKNLYVTGGSEEYYMNLVADALAPYLRSSGIRYTRNTPEMTASSSIAASNRGNYNLHLAIHSNAAPEGRYGELRGSDVYHFPTSTKGRRGAQIAANNLKVIYPDPNLVRTVSTTTIGEVARTRAPAVFYEVAYHDNVEDAMWIIENIEEIGRNIALSVTEFFGLPLLPPAVERQGTVTVGSSVLNIRDYPSTSSAVLARAYNGARVAVLGQWEDWYSVEFGGTVGFAASRYIDVS